MICVLVLAAGASWESDGVTSLGAAPGVVVLKRCMDADDLLASAATGQAEVAVVAMEAPGLDAGVVEHLRRLQVRVIGVCSVGVSLEAVQSRATRIGIDSLVKAHDSAALVTAVQTADSQADAQGSSVAALPTHVEEQVVPLPETPAGKILVVWGPGAPGRTTLAAAIAGDIAGRGIPTTLVDADSHAPAVSQHLGIMDEVSGMLSAARLVTSGMLSERLGTVLRGLSATLRVVTGLPRADRWSEVRAGSIETLLETLSRVGHVVVDTGASLEEDGVDFGSRPGRNAMTLGALSVADEILVVGAADPVGLSRLARGLVDLREINNGTPVRVLINRQRRTIGWQNSEIEAMVHDFSRVDGVYFLPEDQPAVDRALIAGKTLAEAGDSSLRKAVSQMVDALLLTDRELALSQTRKGGLRRRKAGRARRS